MLTKAVTWLSVAALALAVLSRSGLRDLGIMPVSPTLIMGLELACLLAFLASSFALRTQPLLSVPSKTDRTQGSESL